MSTKNKISPMMNQYLAIKEQHKDYLLFYRLGDFYEMFFEDAITASKALDIALTKRGKLDEENIPMCGVPVANHELYLHRLIRKGFKVAICDQMEDPAEAKKRKGADSCVKREVTRIITSGTLTEDALLDSGSNNYLLAIVMDDSQTLGLAWTDMSTGEFLTESAEPASLPSFIEKIDPQEILIPEPLMSDKLILAQGISFATHCTTLPASRFSFAGGKELLQKTFSTASLDAFGTFTKAEITAAGALLDYIALTSKGKIPALSFPKRLSSGDFMHIDAATRRNLELFSASINDEERGQSLCEVLCRTTTAAGTRHFKARLANPLTNLSAINNRLDMIEFFVSFPKLRAQLRALLRGTGDLERIMARLSGGRANPRDLGVLKDTLSQVPEIAAAFMRPNFLPPEAIDKLLQSFGDHHALTELLTRALIPEDLPLSSRDGGYIKRGFNPHLDELKTLRDESRRHISALGQKYVDLTGIGTLKINHNNIIGYFIEVPSRFSENLFTGIRSGKYPFIHRQTLATSARFSSDDLLSLEEKIRGAAEKSLALEEDIFSTLVGEAKDESEAILRTSSALCELDVALALAEIAEENHYTRPTLDDSSAFDIIGGRHPMVEEALKSQRGKTFFANDCLMTKKNPDATTAENDSANEGCIWLITGPNMAGKSTFLRQNALIAIMAQAGMFVPARSAHIGIIDKVFSRVGASDDLAKGRSTFMVEMVETAAILRLATPKSFVILDEIGRGTATFDGLAIAWATLEELAFKSKCRALFATHYHELTQLKATVPTLHLYTMKTKEWQDNIVFLYEIEKGSADKSYGIHVAKLAGMPSPVIARATQIIDGLEEKQKKINELLGDLPLFATLAKEEQENDTSLKTQLEDYLSHLSLDTLSPKEALDTLYTLKDMIKNKGTL